MDSGNFFGIDTSGDPTLIYTPTDNQPLIAFSNVFFTDHVWSPDPLKIGEEWKQLPELRERLSAYCSYSETSDLSEPLTLEQRLSQCDGRNLELDELEITSLAPLDLPHKFPNLETLSLWGNQLSDPNDLLTTISSLSQLKALWINGNPLIEDEQQQAQLISTIISTKPSIEILNSVFTPNYTKWALSYISKSIDDSSVVYMDLSDRSLTGQLKKEAFEPFKNLQKVDFRGNPSLDLSNINNIIPNLHSIFIDEPQLSSIKYSDQIIFINGIAESGEQSLPVPGRIWDHIQPAGSRWGVGDEVSLAIHHSLTPNFAAMPIGSPLNGLTYFVFWPIKDINPLSEITANLFPQINFGNLEEALKEKKLIPMVNLKSKFKSSVTKKAKIKVFTDIDIFCRKSSFKTFCNYKRTK